VSEIEIVVPADRDELAVMSHYKRRQLLGQQAAEISESIVPPPEPGPFPSGRQDGWSGTYTAENIAAVFRKWSAEHDGLAPTQRDWSPERDPDHHWPRAEAVKEAARRIAPGYGVRTQRWAPHDGGSREAHMLVEAGHALKRAGRDDQGLSDTPYCEECRHGSGCMPADMSPWRFAVEILGGLTLRRGTDQRATRSRGGEHAPSRRMVTAGRADVHVRESDPAAREIIETLNP
jgi:hypothetical protein